MATQTRVEANLLGDDKGNDAIDYVFIGEEQRSAAIEELRTELNLQQIINYQEACLKKLRASVRGATDTEMEFLSTFNCLKVSKAAFRNASCSGTL